MRSSSRDGPNWKGGCGSESEKAGVKRKTVKPETSKRELRMRAYCSNEIAL